HPAHPDPPSSPTRRSSDLTSPLTPPFSALRRGGQGVRSGAGSHNVKVLPAPVALSTEMSPPCSWARRRAIARLRPVPPRSRLRRSEEHTSELQSRGHLVCR